MAIGDIFGNVDGGSQGQAKRGGMLQELHQMIDRVGGLFECRADHPCSFVRFFFLLVVLLLRLCGRRRHGLQQEVRRRRVIVGCR